MQKTAPLPFIGQKRNFINHFIKVLNKQIKREGEGWTIIDAFGGSGLLSHVSKAVKPNARVVYNDFDGYHKRLHHIPETNRLRRQLAAILADLPRSKRLEENSKQAVIECIAGFNGFVDIKTVAAWILFSGNFANTVDDLRKQTLYNRIRLSDLPQAGSYLDGLDIIRADFEELLKQYCESPNCLLVLDPPYVCTQQGMYANKTYFGMVEFLRLMRLVRPPFVFFSSTRSELVSYLNFVIHHKIEGYKRFEGYKRIVVDTSVNHNTKYEDNLIYKFDEMAV